ncbi:guanylyl cyclase beta, putative [Plasmodium gallinaceum]|uniref:Guanylyl cyclase beta, putative n=1 Tax=Plasmodium gallinaceum TaxID=5849 RepID=A0A1J1GNE4_PLAGA|nr:guanylyl cyclase beta, putative [Plasmodium gallinaceum]CRG93962.1 guanylyl cyclase beta, putative [Plasmodium gallinaceum]
MKSNNVMKTKTLSLMRKYIETNKNFYRKVIINPILEDDLQKFCKNYFRIYTFSLYNFIRRLISFDAIVVYSLFLIVYIISEISQGITKRYIFIDTAISLSLNFIILVIIESLFELKQFKDIKNANSQSYLRIVPKMSYFEKVMTKDIKVGNIIRVFEGDEFPADVVILYVKNNLNAVVDAFKIDGLFRKSIKYPVDKYKIDRDYLKMLSEINGVIRCELPNKNIFCFQGSFKLDKHPRSLFLSYENFALQSSILKGAEYIDAVVVYTGADTKKNLNIPHKVEENRTFCIKMNNVVYYLIFMYFFFVLLSLIIKIAFFERTFSYQNKKEGFFTILEDFIGLYILVLPIMMYSEKSLIYIIQSLRIENDIRMRGDIKNEKPKVFNKNKNDALGTVDILATARNGILVNKKESFVSCIINNVIYSKNDFVYSRKNFKLPTLNILDAERKDVRELLNLDERIFKDPENLFFPSRNFTLFLKLFEKKVNSIYDPVVDNLSIILKEKYKNYFNEEILNKNVRITNFLKSKLNVGYNQFYEDNENSYNCKEVIDDIQDNSDQSKKIEEFILGMCACNRIVIHNEKCLDMILKEYKSESLSDHYNKYENENDNDGYNYVDESDEENFNCIEHEDICLYNIVKNIGFSIYCYKNNLSFYNLRNECKEYFLICFHDFLRINDFSMCILKNINELDKGTLYVRGYDYNIIPCLSKKKNNLKKIKKLIKLYTLNYLKVIIICKKEINNEEIAKYIFLKSVRKKMSFKLHDLIKLFFLFDLEVIGIIGLKSSLKEGVKETFSDIINFDIRSWIFTNECAKDTYLTALECNLITSKSNLFLINFYNMQNPEYMANVLFNNFIESLDKLKSNSYAIAINDLSIKNIMSNAETMKIFLYIAMRATVVLFCKLKNETKGKIIKKLLSLTSPRLTILGVGSTLNDAYLLKNTTISVCLSLNEQVNVLYNISDYVLHEFKFISDLLILGRSNRFSLCKTFLWIIYFKVMMASFYFFHNFDNSFSGSSISSILYSQTTFAIFHYFLIIAFSAYEIDLPYKFIRHVPYIYQLSRRKYFLNNTIIFLTILEAFVVSFISYYILRNNVFHLISHRAFTFHIFILIFFITSEKIVLLSKTWHLYFFIMTVLIICFLFIYINVYTLIDCLKIGKCEFGLFHTEDLYFWLSLLPILYVNFLIDKFMKFINNKIYPDISDYLRKGLINGNIKKKTKDSENESKNTKEFLDFNKNKKLQKLIPSPNIYHIKDDNTYYNKSKKTRFIYNAFRKIIDINVKYRNQQLNLEYKTYEKRNKLKLRIIVIILFFIYFIIFFSQIITSKIIKYPIKCSSILTMVNYILATIILIYVRRRNKSNSTFFFFLAKILLIVGSFLELYDNINNNIINLLVAYSFTVTYIFFFSFKILEGLIICVVMLFIDIWVYYNKNMHISLGCLKFCDNPYLTRKNLEEVNVSCLCKQQIITFLICMLSFTLICLSMKYYEIYYLKKKFLFRYKQKVNLAKQIEILHTMLPSFLVEYLLISDPKADGIMVGKNISGEDRGIISVIFCDIDDFQNMVTTLQPQALVETLDNLYLYFDKCIKYFNCIKIETVFESYLAASGLNEKQNDCIYKIKYDTKCAIKLAIAQLSAKYYISYKVLDIQSNSLDNNFPVDKYVHKSISLRIGIHTGKAISGVIGSVKPQYSLFGDTVNTASRMKSTSLPDHIQVSHDTYKYLEEDKTLLWKERKIFIKGKGEMKTYLLVDILGDSKNKRENSELEPSSSVLLESSNKIERKKYEEKEEIKKEEESEERDKKTEKKKKKKKKNKKIENKKEKEKIKTDNKLIDDLYTCDKEKIYHINADDDNSIERESFFTYSKLDDEKANYLSSDNLEEIKRLKKKSPHKFESRVILNNETLKGKNEEYDFFTSPYRDDTDLDDKKSKKVKKKKMKEKTKKKLRYLKEYSSSFNGEIKMQDAIKKYIKERKDYEKKFYPPNFNFNRFLISSNKFKKRKRKNQEYTSSYEEGFCNFLNDSFTSNYEFSTESENYGEHLIQNKKFINFDDLFTKIHKKKRNLLKTEISIGMEKRKNFFSKGKNYNEQNENSKTKNKNFFHFVNHQTPKVIDDESIEYYNNMFNKNTRNKTKHYITMDKIYNINENIKHSCNSFVRNETCSQHKSDIMRGENKRKEKKISKNIKKKKCSYVLKNNHHTYFTGYNYDTDILIDNNNNKNQNYKKKNFTKNSFRKKAINKIINESKRDTLQHNFSSNNLKNIQNKLSNNSFNVKYKLKNSNMNSNHIENEDIIIYTRFSNALDNKLKKKNFLNYKKVFKYWYIKNITIRNYISHKLINKKKKKLKRNNMEYKKISKNNTMKNKILSDTYIITKNNIDNNNNIEEIKKSNKKFINENNAIFGSIMSGTSEGKEEKENNNSNKINKKISKNKDKDKFKLNVENFFKKKEVNFNNENFTNIKGDNNLYNNNNNKINVKNYIKEDQNEVENKEEKNMNNSDEDDDENEKDISKANEEYKKFKKKVSKKLSFYSLKEKSYVTDTFGDSSFAIKSNETNRGIKENVKKEYFTASPSLKKKKNFFTKINHMFANYFKSMEVTEKSSSIRNTLKNNTGLRSKSKNSEKIVSSYTTVNNKNIDFANKFDNYNKKLLKKLTSTLQLNKKKVKNFSTFYYKFNDEELEEEYTKDYYRERINIDLTKKLIIIFVISEIILGLSNVIELSYYNKNSKKNDFIVIIWLIRSIYLFIITYIWLLLKVKLKEYKNNPSKMMWTTFILNIFLSSWCIMIIDLSCIHFSNLVSNSNERSLFLMKDATELVICIQLIFIKNMLFKHKFFFLVFFFIFLIYSFSKLFSVTLHEIQVCFSLILILFINILYFWYSEYLDRIQFLVKRKRNRMEKTSQDFLTRILPRQVLEEYQNDNLQLTYKHEKIAFLFADIVGFTKWSKTVGPKDVLKLLQKLISKIDKDTIKLGLYKLFTIGDAYVATSQPNSSITDESEAVEGILNIFKLAKLILHNINTIKIQFNKHDFNMRIGLHYGSCVGGIIGSVRLRYDMWGLDVLIANKIESNGIPGEIICSEQFKSFFLENEPQAKLNFWYYKTIYINDKDIKLYVIEDKNYEEDYDQKILDYETLLQLRKEKERRDLISFGK